MKRLFFLLLLSIFSVKNYSQDTIHKSSEKLTYKSFIIPVGLITVSAILKSPSTQSSIQETARTTFGTDFHTEADNYLQFLPAAQALSGNLLGLESKHELKQIATNLLISNVMVGGVTYIAKTAVHDLRPDGSSNNSFPSGHTATAFNNATLLFLEYKDSNIWYASSGFLFATTTGVLRMANNRHWSGDVVAGAGIGIAIGTIVNYWNPFHFDENKKTGLIGYPFYNEKASGIGFLCTF